MYYAALSDWPCWRDGPIQRRRTPRISLVLRMVWSEQWPQPTKHFQLTLLRPFRDSFTMGRTLRFCVSLIIRVAPYVFSHLHESRRTHSHQAVTSRFCSMHQIFPAFAFLPGRLPTFRSSCSLQMGLGGSNWVTPEYPTVPSRRGYAIYLVICVR